MKEDTIFPMCNRLDEDCSHMFFKCIGVKECWRELNLEEHGLLLADSESGQDMMQKIWSCPNAVRIPIVVLLWR